MLIMKLIGCLVRCIKYIIIQYMHFEEPIVLIEHDWFCGAMIQTSHKGKRGEVET